jgi:hypothetical protein
LANVQTIKTLRFVDPISLDTPPNKALFVILAMTNKPISPVNETLVCPEPFLFKAVNATGPGIPQRTIGDVTQNSVAFGFTSPAWSPDGPIAITLLANANFNSWNCHLSP